MVIGLAEENVRVRLCVQGRAGAGYLYSLPKISFGISEIMRMMD
jgi:hypothetical protein